MCVMSGLRCQHRNMEAMLPDRKVEEEVYCKVFFFFSNELSIHLIMYDCPSAPFSANL